MCECILFAQNASLSYLTLDGPSGGLLCAVVAILATLGQCEQFARLFEAGNRTLLRRGPAARGRRRSVRSAQHLQLVGFDVVVQVTADEACTGRIHNIFSPLYAQKPLEITYNELPSPRISYKTSMTRALYCTAFIWWPCHTKQMECKGYLNPE